MSIYEPHIDSFELLVVTGDYVTADMLVWRRYKIPLAGTRLIEVLLDLNPHIAKLHRYSPFLPPGTPIKMPIDQQLLAQAPKPLKVVTIYGEV